MVARCPSTSMGRMLPDKSLETEDLLLVYILNLKLSASFPGYNPMRIHDHLYLQFMFTFT